MKIRFLAIPLLIGLMLAGCGCSSGEREGYLQPPQTLSIDLQRTGASLENFGFVTMTQALDRQYFFTTDNFEENSELALNQERIIGKIGELVDFQTIPLEIFFYTETSEHRQFDNGRNIFVNPKKANSVGRLISRLNGDRLPLWLYVGLEAVARSQVGLDIWETPLNAQPMAYFGDASFAPATWGSDEQLHAIATAYNFVAFLIESDQLAYIARLYADGQAFLANKLSSQLYYEFAGLPMCALSLHFGGSAAFRFHPTNITYDYRISARTAYANYHFLFLPSTKNLDQQTIHNYISYFDDGARFAKDFFAEFADFHFQPVDVFVIYNDSPHNNIDAFPQDGWIRIFNFAASQPSSFVHEITHFISLWARGGDIGAFEFEEGIAMAMERFHDAYDRQIHGKSYQWKLENQRFGFGSYTVALYEILGDQGLANAAWSRLMADFDTAGLAHLMAYHWLHHRDYEGEAETNRRLGFGSEIAEIGTHPTAGSFVLYLIENYGVQNYMSLHLGQQSFEEVYGVDIQEMIVRWRVFLEDFIDAVGA